ncbi:MAG: HAD hydrolase-like protein [Bacteroidetes bacterium]|nr:HAD hydrolase-like protein [Bacteroidota bacterium]MCY4234163.1 HAD hydrolase-like protein [Bacteroidota bacterium]
MKLLLFDIDGTLLKPIYSGRQHIEAVLEQLCGKVISTEGVAFSGRTDPQIFEDTLQLASYSAVEIKELIPDALNLYSDIATYFPDEVELTNGVAELLESLESNKNVQLALLTGNIRVTAYRKLSAAQVDHLFPFGAFGCDHSDRAQLPEIAQIRAMTYCGKSFSGEDTVIIGDSVHDVTCGRGIGALSVAVATGFTSYHDLISENPSVILRDLTNISEFCTSIGI